MLPGDQLLLRRRQRVQAPAQVGADLHREARADFADVAQLLPFLAGDVQRGDAAHGLHVANDVELLALAGLDLLPAVAAVAGPVWRVGALADDAFPVELLGPGEHRSAVVHVLGIDHWRPQARPLDQIGEQPLALDQRHLPEVVAVGVKKVEGVKQHPVLPTGGDVRLQRAEVGGLSTTTTISPSTTAWPRPAPANSAAIAVNFFVQSRPDRVKTLVPSAETWICDCSRRT